MEEPKKGLEGGVLVSVKQKCESSSREAMNIRSLLGCLVDNEHSCRLSAGGAERQSAPRCGGSKCSEEVSAMSVGKTIKIIYYSKEQEDAP